MEKGGIKFRYVVEKPHAIPAVRSKYYASLADFFLKQIGPKPCMILEAGSGRGQLTFPLMAKLRRNARLVAVDSSTGPYDGSLEQFHSELKRQKLRSKVLSIKSDVRRMSRVKDVSIDAVISNELLCDLRDEVQLGRALGELYRVLRPGGVMIHGEWSSWPANRSQALAIRADSLAGTETPSKFWNPDDLFVATERAGFRDFSTIYFETTMRLKYSAAVEELRNWGVRESFLRQNDNLLRRYGIELPFEHVVRCRRPVRTRKT